MKAVIPLVLFGVLLGMHAELAESGIPDPIFRTGFENSTCSNNILEDGEQCEDSSSADGDGCSSKCQVEPGFQCTGLPSVCQSVCGDGVIVQGIETCDQGNGNISGGDGCSATCQVESGFECTGEPSLCASLCGNSILDAGEACDLGPSNGAPGGTCTITCQFPD